MPSSVLGVLLGLGCAAFFGANSVATRRSVLRASPNYLSIVTVFSGPVFFLLAATATGEILRAGEIPWKAYSFFAATGLINFAIARTIHFRTVQLIGTNRAYTISGFYSILSVVLAAIVLHEPLSPMVILGVLVSLSGPILTALKENTVSTGVYLHANPHRREVDRGTLYQGMLLGAASALLYSTGPLFIKLGLDNGGTSLLGSLTAYLTASLIISPALLSQRTRAELVSTDSKVLRLALLGSATACAAQLLRYTALANSTVTTVSMMERTFPVWSLLFAYIFNRRHESFSRWVILGNVLLLAGSALVII